MIKFFKMHGIGNDYIFIDKQENYNIKDYIKLSQKLSDRNLGIGSCGLIVLEKSKIADIKMTIYNSDGSRASMCGNASRCVCLYVYKKQHKKYIKIETENRIIKGYVKKSKGKTGLVCVFMGKAKLVDKIDVFIDNSKINLNIVDVGNLHAVIKVDNFDFDINSYVKKLEQLNLFKDGINYNFVKIIDKDKIQLKVYERGSGLTKACGSGACATSFMLSENKIIDCKKIKVIQEGGNLIIQIKNNNIFMTGTANFVFKGEF